MEISLRHEDAVSLIDTLREKNTDTFRIEFLDDPSLSAEYHVAGLREVLEENDVECFN